MKYIRVEAQNLYSTVLDTDKLSVTRGGSLRWREAMVGLVQRVADCAQITLVPISTGASIGEFTCATDASDAVTNVLRHDYPELTFAVSSDNDRKMCERDARWQQFQQLTLAPERGLAASVCEFTKVRAGTKIVHATENGAKDPPVGWSVTERHNFGRGEKQSSSRPATSTPLQRFYKRETGQSKIGAHEIDSLLFSNEFSEIAKGFPFAALENKLAVFYADGNKFSRFVNDKSDAELSAFDIAMSGMRKQLLHELLDWVLKQRDQYGPNQPIPVEVLLWGGDEYTFVLPAWLGWEFAQRFFDVTKAWKFSVEPAKTAEALTHAAGLVFCHHKTPIGRIRDLARELADGVKVSAPNQNAFDYLVLESLDFPAQSIAEYWKARVRTSVADARKALVPNPEWLNVDASRKKLEALKNHQVYRLAHALGVRAKAEEFVAAKVLLDATGIKEADIQSVRSLFSNSIDAKELWTWIHLRELSQYLCPAQDKPQAGTP